MTNFPDMLSAAAAGVLLRERREDLKMTQEQLAEAIGTDKSYISKLEGGVYNVGRSKYFPAVARALRLSEDDIRSINPSAVFDAPHLSLPSGRPSRAQKMDTLDPQHGVTLKNVYDLAQASRPLEEMEPDPEVSPIPVLSADLYPGTELFRVRGESMSIPGGEGIEAGDIIYVDTRDLSARAGEIYVFHIPGDGVTVKRVRALGGQLWLFSDNPDQNTFPPFAVDEARVIGRVHFAFRPLPQFKRRAW